MCTVIVFALSAMDFGLHVFSLYKLVTTTIIPQCVLFSQDTVP